MRLAEWGAAAFSPASARRRESASMVFAGRATVGGRLGTVAMRKSPRGLYFFGDGVFPLPVPWPPTLIGVLQIRHRTTLLRSWSSTSMYLRHFTFGHCTAKTMSP